MRLAPLRHVESVRRLTLCLFLGLLPGGCQLERPPTLAVLHTRVVRERDCHPSAVVVEALGASAYRVEACGKVATFSCLPLAYFDHCTREGNWEAE